MKKCIILFMLLLTMSFIWAGPITTGSLFEEMIDMKGLTYYPYPFYKNVQYSSYDHTSQIPGGPNWFNNADGFGGELIPNFEKVLKNPNEEGIGEYLIADVDGPGAIVRLWTAWINGDIKMYIDGNEKPVYDGSAQEFFTSTFNPYPEMKKINPDNFEKAIYQQDASYAPIPFEKHLRVVWIGKIDEIHFYQMQVRLYDETAEVKSFSPRDIAKYRKTIDHVTDVLVNPDKHFVIEDGHSFEEIITPSEKKNVFRMEGSKAMQILTLRIEADDLDNALRQTVMNIICDEHPWGQVQCPVGDFFGVAPGINPYQSLPFTVKPDGTMICRFVMPFSKSLKIQMENFGDQEVKVTGTAQFVDYVWYEKSMYFRAKWRVSHNLTGSGKDIFDLPFLIARGKGIYVGSTSILMNPCGPPTPYGGWWGEGDEKVFVDDDFFPSIFGTGSEDYYNYSWSIPDIFYHPYCGQPRNDGPGNRGYVTNYRWQILDPIPFKNTISFYMELCTHEPTPGFSYARIGYHYGTTGMMDDSEPLTPDDVRIPPLPENWQPAAKKGSANAVFFQAEDIVRDPKNIQMTEGNLWSGSKLMVWKPKKVGDEISFTVPNSEKGKRRIYITAALTPRSGAVEVLYNGKPAVLDGDTNGFDLYRPYRTMLRNFSIKSMDIPAGDHVVTLKFKGAPETVTQPEIGIDFIWIQKATW